MKHSDKKTEYNRRANLPPGPGPGRKPGSKNKSPLAMINSVVDQLGREKWLLGWVKESKHNERIFVQAVLEIGQKEVTTKTQNEHSGEVSSIVKFIMPRPGDKTECPKK